MKLIKKYSIYYTDRRTRRWLTTLFRVLDLITVNAHILYNLHTSGETTKRSVFLKLARALVVPQMQRRVQNMYLPRELRMSIKRVLGLDAPEDQSPIIENRSNKLRKLCYLCPTQLKRKTAYHCNVRKYVCLQCSQPVCKECL